MCNAMAFAAASFVAQGVSSFAQGQNEARALEAEALNIERQALYKDEEARTYNELGELQKRRVSVEASQIIGEGKVSFAAGNIALSSAQVDTWEVGIEEQAEAERALIDYDTRLKQWRTGVESSELRTAASQRRQAAESVSFTGNLLGAVGVGVGAVGLGASLN